MASLNKVNQMYKDLKTEFTRSKPDLKKCGTLLDSLKVNTKDYNQVKISHCTLIF